MALLEGQTCPKGGWVSYAYSQKSPAPQLIHMKGGHVPVRFLTALYIDGKAAVDLVNLIDESEVTLSASVEGTQWSITLLHDSYAIQKVKETEAST